MALPGVLSSLGFSASGQSLRSLLRMASESNCVLVMIYLEGGNDGLNTVVPLDKLSHLNAARPQVVLPESSLLQMPEGNIGLHPSLSYLKELYTENRLAIVQNVGYPDQNFSHFRSTDIWMSASDSDQVVSSGWTGRYLSESYPEYPDTYDENGHPLAIEIGYGASLLLQGPAANMGMVIQDPETFYELLSNEEPDAPDTPAGDKLKYVRLIAKQSQQFGRIVSNAANQADNAYSGYPETGLANQLKIVSRLIAGGLTTPVYLVKIGGFDTHAEQVEADDHTRGFHAELLSELDGAISAFMKDLEMLGNDDRVVGMTFSEFGRRVVANDSTGTDHGSAAPMFFFGNAVKRNIHGSNPDFDNLSPNELTYAYNMGIQFDFRQLYGSIMEQWLNVPTFTVNNVLFSEFETLGIIGEDVVLDTAPISSNQLKVYPNPLNGIANIELYGDGHPYSLQLVDLQGKLVSNIGRGTLSPGRHVVQWQSANLPSGRYFIIHRSASGKKVASVVK